MTDEHHSSTLAEQIERYHDGIRDRVPAEVAATLSRELERLAQSGIARRSLQVGSKAPDFALPDQSGEPVRLSKVLGNGPAVVTFYRGGWCPYCNLQLRAYQTILPDITALGSTLLAISPQTPDFTLSTVQEKGLGFPVLSDLGNDVARRYGLVFVLPEALQDLQRKFGNEIPRFNGDDSWELPMPGTFIVSRDGIVRLASVDSDYRRRLEPATILACLAELS
jgi:peroxiredoxin